MKETMESLQSALRTARNSIQAGALPSQMVANALASAEAGDAEAFVERLEALFPGPDSDIPSRLDRKNYVALASAARKLELEELGAQLLQAGVSAHPEDSEMRYELRRYLARSSAHTLSERGQKLIEEQIGLDREHDPWVVDPAKLSSNLLDFGLLMDLLEGRRAFEDAVRVSEAAHKALPKRSKVLRNYGRALTTANRWDEGFDQLKASLWAEGASDIEAAFFAAALSRHGESEEALEAYLLAAYRDPDDADNFVRSAIALLVALEAPESLTAEKLDDLKPGEILEQMVRNALSCSLFSQSDGERIRPIISHAKQIGIALDAPALEREFTRRKEGRIPLPERETNAKHWYQRLKTDLTAPPAQSNV
jgi:tetratricopeptide (TPR) repeat protein